MKIPNPQRPKDTMNNDIPDSFQLSVNSDNNVISAANNKSDHYTNYYESDVD